MKRLQKIWNNFTAQPDVWFFYGFLLTFSLSIRKVLFFYSISGQFNEYSGIYLYLSDILLILAIVSWIISLLYNKYTLLSIFKATCVPRGTIILSALLVLWSFLSIYWSSNINLALFRSLKLLELYLLFLYLIIKIVPRGTILRSSVKIIIGIGFIQAIISIWQFVIQHSIGLFWLKESLISTNLPGVAKIILNNGKLIRAYGLFPHPNILGGFIFVSIILTLFYRNLFHVEQKHTFTRFVAITILISGLILTFSKSAIIALIISFIYIYANTHVPRGTYLSRFRARISKFVRTLFHAPRKMFHVEHILRSGQSIKLKLENVRIHSQARKIALIIVILFMLVILIKPNMNSLIFRSLDERLLYLNVSRGTILAHPILGLGSGQFVVNMQNYANQTLLDWQFQPVHNVFLLIWNELGLIGLGLFILLLWKLFHVEQNTENLDIKCSTWNNGRCEVYEPIRNNDNQFVEHELFHVEQSLHNRSQTSYLQPIIIFQGILAGLLFIMPFDHYLWDIQQGQVMLWLIMGIIAGMESKANIDKL